MIFNVTGGGGGAGGALTVTAPANVMVTVSKDGKTKTKNSGTSGVVVFRGLETGTWTITIANGTDTATKTVEIKADYSTQITFFSATINVTYPAGLACTATDGSTTLNAPDTSGTWACVVPNAGTWTVTLDNGLYSTVTITNSGEKHTVDKWDLYNAGNEYPTATGGWSGSGYYYSPNGVVGSGTKKETYIDLYSTRAGERSVCGTVNTIDLTHFRQIRVKGKVLEINYYQGKAYGIDIYVTKTKDFKNRTVVLSVNEKGDFDVEVDIGSLSGSFYICCATASTEGNRGEIYRVSLL